ncbi:hypothetical protein GCM10010517_13940 [Streptosporangium fragile]|uniref:Uncharacterized protein n=1 Tax=Streptosporangium fragile TaxID=46186 RepID=A0ABN3VS08_9ACTN
MTELGERAAGRRRAAPGPRAKGSVPVGTVVPMERAMRASGAAWAGATPAEGAGPMGEIAPVAPVEAVALMKGIS